MAGTVQVDMSGFAKKIAAIQSAAPQQARQVVRVEGRLLVEQLVRFTPQAKPKAVRAGVLLTHRAARRGEVGADAPDMALYWRGRRFLSESKGWQGGFLEHGRLLGQVGNEWLDKKRWAKLRRLMREKYVIETQGKRVMKRGALLAFVAQRLEFIGILRRSWVGDNPLGARVNVKGKKFFNQFSEVRNISEYVVTVTNQAPYLLWPRVHSATQRAVQNAVAIREKRLVGTLQTVLKKGGHTKYEG